MAVIHKAVENLYRDLILPVSVSDRFVRGLLSRRVQALEDVRNRRRALKAELSVLDQRNLHVGRAFAEGLMTIASHDLACAELKSKREGFLAQISALERPNAAPDPRAIVNACRTALDLHAQLGSEDQKLLAEAVFESIVVDKDRVVSSQSRVPEAT